MKRLSSGTWFLISLMLLAMGVLFWQYGDRLRSRHDVPAQQPDIVITNGQVRLPNLGAAKHQLATRLSTQTLKEDFAKSTQGGVKPDSQGALAPDPRFPYRLRNTLAAAGELSKRDSAIMLQNALIDSESVVPIVVPEHLRAAADTRSYLLQSVGPFDAVFDSASLDELNIQKVAYVPHNAWIVRMDPGMAKRLERLPGTAMVRPFDPYFKLNGQLLEFAVQEAQIPGRVPLQLTLFNGMEEAMFAALEGIGTEYLGGGKSPFGETVWVSAERAALSEIASLDGVLSVELMTRRQLANDLTRRHIGVDNSLTNTVSANAHDLTGEDILIGINDTGIDSSHPDLASRVFSIDSDNLEDLDGHGTHVAGTIASTGMSSPIVTNSFGSPTNANFRGMAPSAELFVLPIDLVSGPLVSDAFLQETAAEYNYVTESRTNAMISNNSWNFRNARDYNSSAASYDAAVRDSLPEMEGEQPVLYVFSAGNGGSGNELGRGGDPASIFAPATAKNVITVGALESLRFITNEVIVGFIDEVMTNDMGIAVTNEIPIMERVFEPATDSSTQVASFSSRGNVGIGIEGDFGRFKPDVVAPGTFTISTRAQDWESPEQFLDVTRNVISNQTAVPGELTPHIIFARQGVAEIEINVRRNAASPDNLPRMPIYAQYGTEATEDNLVGFTSVLLDEEPSSPIPVTPGILFYSIGNPLENPISFDIETIVRLETESDDYFEQLEMLNESLAPDYRFETGTSMAAPAVTGLLGLFQEFLLEQGHNPSPALLKALLINGSRTAGELYDFQIDPTINFQGWGTVNLANSLPDNLGDEAVADTEATLQFFDQDVDNALATGEQRSWNLTLNTNEARALPLRLSLVWTDPPGSPTAGIKLVNDLDLIVSNTMSGEIFYGNNFGASQRFTSVTSSNQPPVLDNVNNVENIYISPPLSTNYVVSVVARRVNVNSVHDHPDGVVQDFALVVSSGDNPEVDAPFMLEPIETEEQEFEYVEVPAVVNITNSIPRLADRVGANAPLLGTTNGLLPQWQFYTFTNSLPSTNDVGFTNGPNVAFVTFLPPNLARPRNLEADVDLFVSRDRGLLSLNEAAISGAFRSTEPGGSEVVILENQPLGDDVVYYVGVKSEDHQGGQYALVGISQEDPFDFTDDNGNRVLRGVPLNQGIIPDGSPNEPGAALVLALGNPLNGLTVQSAIAELSLVHDDIGDLLGNVSHNGVSVVLNNHNLLNPDGGFTSLNVTYDDFETIVPSVPTDGPGSLINFIGENGTGVWLMSMVDNALTHTGRVSGFNLRLTPSLLQEGVGIFGVVQPESFAYFVIEVPTDASALEVFLSEFDLPLDLYLRREELPTLTQFDKRALGTNDAAGLTLRLTRTDIPPLNPGQYFIGVYNPNEVPVEFRLEFNFERDLIIDAEQPFFPDELDVPITDDAITQSTIFIPDTRGVADVKVGLRIDHPRASDLTMHLTSPLGTRVLLSENRGGDELMGWGTGTDAMTTYAGFSDDETDADTPIKFALPPFATNAVTRAEQFSGFEEALPDIYTEGQMFLANANSNMWEVLSGRAVVTRGALGRAAEGRNFLNLASARLAAELPTEPGRTVDLFYSARSSAGRGAPIGNIFLDGRLAQVVDGSFRWRRNSPVRFTPGRSETLLELAFERGRPPLNIDDLEIRDATAVKYYFPEEALDAFDGEPAVGEWTLEVWDNRAGAVTPEPILQNWQLLMSLANTNFPATALSNGECATNTVVGDEIQFYIVDVPRIATIATNWLTGTGDLVLYYNQDGVPQASSPPDVFPPIDFNSDGDGEGMVLSRSGLAVFDPSTNQIAQFPIPTLQPGQRYYLGVGNADPEEENTYELCVQFDQDDVQITTLTNLIAFTNTAPFLDEISFQYYRYRAGSNVLSFDIEIFPEDGDVNAVEKFDLPLPNLVRFDNRAEEMGLDPELITITNRAPATVVSGNYFIGVYNVEPNQTDVRYSILVTETTAPYNVIRLNDREPLDFTVGNNLMDDIASVDNYFLLSITNPAVSLAQFDIHNLSTNANLILHRDALPQLDDNFRSSFADTSLPGSGKMVIRTNNVQTNLVGDWFLAVLNSRQDDLDFTVTGSTYTNDVPVNDLLNNLWFTNTVVGNIEGAPPEVDYYRFVVTENMVDVTFDLEPIIGGMTSNVDLLIRQGQVPTETEFDHAATMTGPATEFIQIGPMGNLPIAPGEWFLAVVNSEGEEPVSYRLRGSATIDLNVVDLESGVWYTNTVAATVSGQLPDLDVYQFRVHRDATSVTFDLEPLVASPPGNIDLVVREGDLPDLATFDFASINAGIVPEQVLVDGSSTPPINFGQWFAGVINREDVAVPYRIRAIQIIPDEPPPGPTIGVIDPEVTLIRDQICLTWDSEPGVEYFVQGKIRDDDPVWDGLRGPILADSVSMTECFPNTIPYQFFRIIFFEGGTPPTPGDVVDTGLRLTPTEVCVTWTGFEGTEYTVQAKQSIMDPSWTFVDFVTADRVDMEYCIGLPTDFRFFRVVAGRIEPEPTDPTFLVPDLVVADNELCLSWDSVLGQIYTVEGQEILGGVWQTLQVVSATGLRTEHCVALPSNFRFFRVRVGGELPPPAPVFIDPEIQITDSDLCLVWVSEAGQDYVVEAKRSLTDGAWDELSVVSATGSRTEYCLSLPTDYRFFRIRVAGASPPVMGPRFVEPSIAVSATEICLDWPATPGQAYTIQGRRSIADADWTDVETITVSGAQGNYCVPLPTDFRFFRIAVVDTPPAPEPPPTGRVIDPRVGISGDQICLNWDAEVGGRYAIQAVTEIVDLDWMTVSEIVAAETSPTFCFDLTTDFRFFRIVELGMAPPPEDPPANTSGFVEPFIRANSMEVCVDWASQIGVTYVLQTKSTIDQAEWTSVETVEATGEQSTVCLSEFEGIGFFRVAILEGDAPMNPIPPMRPPVALEAIATSDSGVVLSWTADPSQRFQVEFTDAFPPTWTLLPEVITSSDGVFTFTDDGSVSGSSTERFYRLRELP